MEADVLRCTEVSRGMSLTGQQLPRRHQFLVSASRPKADIDKAVRHVS
jgi:hypothetical protein